MLDVIMMYYMFSPAPYSIFKVLYHGTASGMLVQTGTSRKRLCGCLGPVSFLL